MKKGQKQVKTTTKKCDSGCRGHKTRVFDGNLNVKHCLRVQKNTTLEKDVSICGNLNVKGNITSNQIDTPTLNTTTLNSTTVNATNVVTTNLTTTNAEVSNLTVESINGNPFGCGETFINTNSDITRVVDNIKPENPGFFNQTVWDNLWDITQLQMNALSDRLQCGRLQERFIQEKFGCVVCPPDQLADCHPTCPGGSGGDICACPDEVGECPRVPISVWGIKSISPFVNQQCSSTTPGTSYVTQLASTIAYNLDVINITGTLSDRVVSVLVQVGYIDSIGIVNQFVYEQIDFGNRQFGPTLDTVYGEKYTGTIVLPTSLMLTMTQLMPNQLNSAVVQMVIFKEDGVDIDVPTPLITPFSRKPLYLQQRADDAQPGAVDVQSVQTPVAKPLDRSAYAGYFASSDQPPITPIARLESTVVINQSAPNTAFAMSFSFLQNIDIIYAVFGFFGTPDEQGGPFSLAVNIYNALSVSLTPGAPYVLTYVDSVASILYIPANQIFNFPVEVDNSYTLVVNRTENSFLRSTYEFVVNNITNDTSVNLGTAVFDNHSAPNISGNKISQVSQYNGPAACADTPQSIATWTYPILNGIPNSTKFNPFFPQTNQCGTFLVEPNAPSGPTVITYPATAPPAP